jgi:subfamily B ATP-binding cassette protein MsbA
MGNQRDNWALYKRLLAYVRPYRGRLVNGILLTIAFGVSNGAKVAIVKTVWAKVFESGASANLGWAAALFYASLVPLAMFVSGVCDFGSTYLMNWVGGRAVNDLRVRLFEHLQTLSLDYFTETRTGELISRATNDVGAVQNAVSNVVGDIVKQPCTLISVLVPLLYFDWRLTLMMLVLFPLCLIPITVYGRRTRKAAKAGQEHQSSLTSVLHEALVGMRVVKAFGMEGREAADFRKLCMNLFSQRLRVARSKAISTPLIEMISGLGAAFVFLYAYKTGMPSSTLVAMGIGLFLLYEPVKKLSAVQLQLQESLSAAERVFQVLDQKPSVVESATARVLPPLQKGIRYENVSFRYGTNDLVLDQIDLEVPAGSVVALVGASGSGKTTLFNLLPRFYDPTGGVVRIDGQDLRDTTFQSLRGQIGLVTQETFLFNDTVASNIAYGKPGASHEEIVEAAKRAHAHDFISQMPQQYDTMIGEVGMKLSGGQRQRLAIARAILRNPPMLLLDEATSALDTESERVVQAALDDLMWGDKKHHTMVVIAHRLSTVQHADQIVVLDQGRIVERGTHEQLIQRGGAYKRLYEMQFTV